MKTTPFCLSLVLQRLFSTLHQERRANKLGSKDLCKIVLTTIVAFTLLCSQIKSVQAKEVVDGLGRGGQCWIAVRDADPYNFRGWFKAPNPDGTYCQDKGETHPTFGEEESDVYQEVIVGYGVGSQGWVFIGDDLYPCNGTTCASPLIAWIRVPWATYNAYNGETRPAAGDLDGDGTDEIVIGLGPVASDGGWVDVHNSVAGGYLPLVWLRVPWSGYNSINGETWPALGNLDADPQDEIVLGLGQGGQGWFEIRDDAVHSFAHLAWVRVQFSAYNNAVGSTRPSLGDIDGDGRDEIVIGLGPYPQDGGWYEIFDDATTGYAHLKWKRLEYSAYNSSNGETRPAVGNLDADPKAEIVIGLGQNTNAQGWNEIFGAGVFDIVHKAWIQVPWILYNGANGETFPAVGASYSLAAASNGRPTFYAKRRNGPPTEIESTLFIPGPPSDTTSYGGPVPSKLDTVDGPPSDDIYYAGPPQNNIYYPSPQSDLVEENQLYIPVVVFN